MFLKDNCLRKIDLVVPTKKIYVSTLNNPCLSAMYTAFLNYSLFLFGIMLCHFMDSSKAACIFPYLSLSLSVLNEVCTALMSTLRFSQLQKQKQEEKKEENWNGNKNSRKRKLKGKETA